LFLAYITVQRVLHDTCSLAKNGHVVDVETDKRMTLIFRRIDNRCF